MELIVKVRQWWRILLRVDLVGSDSILTCLFIIKFGMMGEDERYSMFTS